MKTFKFFQKPKQGNYCNGINLDIVVINILKYFKQSRYVYDAIPVKLKEFGVDTSMSLRVDYFDLDINSNTVMVEYHTIGNDGNVKKRYSFTMSLGEFSNLFDDV